MSEITVDELLTKTRNKFLLSNAVSVAAKGKPAWTTHLKPGDKVCLYDIGKDDPMVGNGNYSLKYWYRSPIGTQRSRLQLRPSVRKLLLKVLWPGLEITGSDENGNWYSATLLVIKNGHESKKSNPILMKRGENTLISKGGRSWIPNWHVLKFTRVRLKKKPLVGKCFRKYEVY